MLVFENFTVFINPIPTGLGHVTLIYGLIPPKAGRNRVKKDECFETCNAVANCNIQCLYWSSVATPIKNWHNVFGYGGG